ncbi:hypothetical protein BH10PSE7_BH10PSE7_26260 [soil metagenome]
MLDRCGGLPVLSKIVMAFYDRVLDSPILCRYFVNSDLPKLLDHQTHFIASLMTGLESYSADQLKLIHANLKIDKAAFDEMLNLFEQTLQGFEVEAGDVKTIMDKLRQREALIVTR